MSFVPTLAGIAWDPEIRGILSVAVGVTVLMGSVYLLLATNVAHRLGFLLSLAAVFGWLTIHGLVWLIYPPIMGPAGRAPSRDAEEIDELTAEEVDELSEQYADELDGWTLLAASDASRGEAQTAVDAVLAEGVVPGLESADSRVFTYSLETGGKPERKSDSVFDRVANKVTNSLRPTHPPHYMLVQLQPAEVEPSEPGEPPNQPEAIEGSQTVTVVLVRDLGQRRLPASLVLGGSGLIF